MSTWTQIADHIADATGAPFQLIRQQSLGGGCINSAARLEGDGGAAWFVKLNHASGLAMFEAEAAGLAELAEAGAVRVPRPLCSGVAGDSAFLVMESLAMGGGSAAAMRRFGRELAALHRVGRARFGWYRDNTIGSTHQPNAEADDWVEFYRERRLGFQLELAARNGFRGALQRSGDQMMARLDAFFSDYRPVPSLLHGDLWSGNYGVSRDGEPVIFDPAVYYGDREADLAMSELFGSFGADFYAAYAEAWPIDPGYTVRKTLYNLYHILNHANMFGGGYAGQAESMLGRLLAEVR